MNRTGVIYGINGPVVYIKGNTGFKMAEMVYVGKEKLVGEVIGLDKDRTTIQVFEETTGIKPGEIVEATGDAISVYLAPGILHNIFDGIERPLSEIAKIGGAYISRGTVVDSLDKEKLWDAHMIVKEGDRVAPRQTLFVLEAMKMENNIDAERGGVVKSIHVQKGATVMEGDLLIVIE